MRQVRRSPLEEVLRSLLVARREAAGLTQMELAVALQRPQSFVSKVERGERRLEVVEFLDYSHALGASAEELIRSLLSEGVGRARGRGRGGRRG